MGAAKAKPKARFSLTGMLVPLVSLGVLFVCWRQDLKWMTIPVVVFLAFYYLILPRLVRARLVKFHRDALKLLTTGHAKEVPRLVRRNIILQLFGPRGPLDAKLGLAYAASEEFARAIPCFESGIQSATPEEKPALQVGLAKALFVSGELARAETEGRAVFDRGIRLPELLVVVARSRVGLGKNDDTTRAMLNDAEQLSPDPDVQLMVDLTRIEMRLATGRKPGEIPQGADSSTRFIRAWIHLVRGLLRDRRGSRETARESYSKATQLGGGSFVKALAREHLTEHQSDSQVAGDSASTRDPAVQRKRKKRR
ncbi:MAG: hypothetical protein GY854_34505 [Deltaproteobacteria bacterium]|nr:hypothetical protein [Deltaproteobacteria bacterium]